MKEKIIKARNSFHSDGFIKSSEKILINGFYKPYRNHLSYVLKHKKYAQNVIFIAGFPKSGTTWIGNLFSSLDGFDKFIPSKWGLTKPEKWGVYSDLYPSFFDEFKKRLAVIKGHTWGSPYNVQILEDSKIKYLITVRDPRDKIISHYWYVKKRPNHWDYPLVTENSLLEFISYKLKSGEFEKESIEWLRAWIRNRDKDNSIIIKYEDMLNNTYLEMKRVLDFLEINCSQDEINKIVEKNSFKNISGRAPGSEDTSSFLRKGISGEWNSVFSPYQKELFHKIGGDVTRCLGYDTATQ